MKTIISFLFVVFLINTTRAQITYFNYLDYTSEWRIYGGGWNGWCCNEYYYKTIYFDGDTTINGQAYYKQFSSIKNILNNGATITFSLTGPEFVREDSAGKFLKYLNNTSEMMFFDNQLVTNYQIGNPIQYPGASNCFVQQISVVNFGSRLLKHVFGSISNLNTGVFEGVGELGYPCGLGTDDNANINCYSKQNDTIQFGTYNCGAFPVPQRTNVVTQLNKKNINYELKIYPNPANDILNIVSEEMNSSNSIIEIKNYLGQVIFTSPFTNQIDIHNLSSGMYFLTILDKEKKQPIKIIKQ